jgi:nucleoside-diphosphate-sugar epimerase
MISKILQLESWKNTPDTEGEVPEMSASVLVTGGAGFIGSHLTEHLLDEGHSVKVVDDLATGNPGNLDPVRGRVDFHEIDLRSDKLGLLLDDVDWVFHQGAIPSVPRSFSMVVESTEVNIMGTVKLFEEARKRDVERVVFASSSSVYGDRDELPKHEGQEPKPQSPYAASKVTCERYAKIFSEHMDLNVVGLRYFNVFGPRQGIDSDYAAVVPNFITAFLAGETPVIYGDGEQSRDFTYVTDVVRANLAALREGESGAVYNVGRNDRTTVNELLYEIRRITGSQLEPRYEEPRPGDVRHSRAKVERLRKDTGFKADTLLEDGLRKTVEWFREHPDRWEDDADGS